MKKAYIIFMLFPLLLLGQNIKFKTISTEDGLSNNSILDIVSDQYGMLWVATWDGLNRYDGNSFKVFKHAKDNPSSISGNKVRQLVKDRENHIWALTEYNSVSKYLGADNFSNYDFEAEIKNLHISRGGDVLVTLLESNKTYVFKGETFVDYSSENSLTENINSLDPILLIKYPEVEINQSIKDFRGNIWFATKYNGIYIVANNSSDLHNDEIHHYQYDPYSKYSFNSNEIEKLFEDDFGNMWLGHKDGGLSMAYKDSEKISLIAPHPKYFPNLPNETIRAITKDQYNNLWLGYYNQGLYRYDSSKKQYVEFIIPEAKENKDWNRVRSLYTSSDGSIWVGTYGGVLRINGSSINSFKTEKNSLFPNNRNYSFFEDNSQNVWIACWGGLAKFSLEKNTFLPFLGQDKLSQLLIRKVVVTGNEVLMATETRGMVMLNHNSGEVNSITSKTGALGNSIYDVYKDPKTNYYWIASLGGITVYDLKKGLVKNITEKEGLPSHLVYSLIPYGDQIWISTTKGIAMVSTTDFSVMSLNPDEGWQAAEFSEGAYYKDIKGTLYFAGVGGMNFFSPNNMNFLQELPKLKITLGNLSQNDTFLIKDYSDNNLTMEITPISFTNNVNNKVQYKLAGYDKNWNTFDSNPISYMDIPYGDYTMIVKNSLDKSGTKMVKIPLRINKPFYVTWYFLLIIFIFILIAIGYWILDKNRKAQRYQRELEQNIKERTGVIDAQKKDLIIANTILDEKHKEIVAQKEELLELHHQLKNEDFEIEKFKAFALSEFKVPIDQILDLTNGIGDDQSVKFKLQKQAGKLTNLIMEWDFLNQVKDIGDTRKSAIKLGPIVNNLLQNLSQNAFKSNINLKHTQTIPDNWIFMDALRFKLLFQYLFSDLIKYGSLDCNLQIDIVLKEEFIKMEIYTDSSILAKNASSIEQYSPYFRAVMTLIHTLEGELNWESKGEGIHLWLSIPAENVPMDVPLEEEISWRQLKLEEDLMPNRFNIIVYGEESDFVSARQLLLNEDYNLLFEDSTRAISSLIKKTNVHGLVIYNSAITEKLISLLQQIKNQDQLVSLPMVYISEQIDHLLQEQTLELGVDAFIQLPARESFINKKLCNLLEIRKEFIRDQSKYQLFHLQMDGDKMLSPNEKMVQQGLEIIKTNLANTTFNVQQLRNQLEISKIKCYRIFKEVLKKSPSEVISELRLQKAEYLLRHKTLNISEISFECGFNDPKYFSKMFKKHFGSSPKAYKSNISV
ncbi:AraC family transcriptional regulator [Arenibacter sp. H213]|uniref:Two-component regulator propeller domain-containing protein n=1 Tax=Arenibacter antarcticus TaxID=2040469 RepID=A0ABW5VF49_9FLAO|nr:AraC family transcriptional regulator [Arenibacter sp. H213]